MRIVRPYVGPNSYDFHYEDGILFGAVGCFATEPNNSEGHKFFASLLMSLLPPQAWLITQFQSMWWDRISDSIRLRKTKLLNKSKDWISLRIGTQDDLSSIIQEFWSMKEIRFYAMRASDECTKDELEKWYRLYIEEFGGVHLSRLAFVAEETLGEGFLMVRSMSIEPNKFESAISSSGVGLGLEFHHNREPFREFFEKLKSVGD